MIQACLPKRNDPVSISLKAKIPFKALEYREALIWRASELASTACRLLEEGELAAGTLLVRGLMETSAALWFLNRKIKDVVDGHRVGSIDEDLMRLLMGSRTDLTTYESFNVLTLVDKIAQEIPSFRREYEALSQIAHPNWCGTMMLYSRPNTEKIWTDFGKHVRDNESVVKVGLINLNAGLQIFEYAYNQIVDLMPRFIEICEKALDDSVESAR
ncbi:MAG: hypothetical protein HYY65_12415 [Candidatus Tectomicrobia bacterium]|uniref:Uncharacterized protein n=1 Tax=Tectimicrobiota bacterium TaxID=2528274 RepID=A0A932GS14_UNCTE|nr:hypothetical protein [Candidatus Tectomicrobia bacterium]